jgi:hypothetical protein
VVHGRSNLWHCCMGVFLVGHLPMRLEAIIGHVDDQLGPAESFVGIRVTDQRRPVVSPPVIGRIVDTYVNDKGQIIAIMDIDDSVKL